MKNRYCSQCGVYKETYKAGQCRKCWDAWMERKKQLRKEGFYDNLKKLQQPRYFNFLREKNV